MPAMDSQIIRNTAIARFQSLRVTLLTVAGGGGRPGVVRPVGGTQAAGSGVSGSSRTGTSDAVRVAGATVGGGRQPTAKPMDVPPALFVAGSNSVGDVEQQRLAHDQYMSLFDHLAQAIVSAHQQWKKEARFVGVAINGPIATGGRIEGPDMEGLIRIAPAVAGWGDWMGGIRDGVAAGVANCWKDWAAGPKVPGLPWYPLFAAFGGPIAPPTPNVPTRLVACAGSLDAMTPLKLKHAIANKLRNRNMDYAEQFADAIGAGISAAFLDWLPQQMVIGVMGGGRVPSFAPPYVPVGPVVMGDNLPTPGHLST